MPTHLPLKPPELAVFMAQGEPHPYWASPEALAWACHPIGPAPQQPGVLRLLKGPSGASVDQEKETCEDPDGEVTKVSTEAPTGIVCWFHDTGRSIIVGFADFRYVLCLDQDQSPSLQRQAYKGPVRGWQPSERCPPPLELIHALEMSGWLTRDFLAGLVEQSRSLLAGVGPEGMVLRPDELRREVLQPLVQARSTGECEDTPFASDKLKADISLHTNSANMACHWLYRRFKRAQRRHPTLGNLIAWAHTQCRETVQKLTSDRHNQPLVMRELAWLAHPGTPLHGVNDLLLPPGLSSSERQCADILVEGWGQRGRLLAMPTKTGARWWLSQSERTRQLMARWVLGEDGGYQRLSELCHLLAPLGVLRVSRANIRLLSEVPDHWIMSAFIVQARGQPDGDGRDFPIYHCADREEIVKIVENNPVAAERAAWMVRQIIRLPRSRTCERPGMPSLATEVVRWFFDSDDRDDQEGKRLLLIEKGWTWASLERLYHRWCLDEDVNLDLCMKDKGLHEWNSLVPRYTQGDIEVIPLCGRAQLLAAGHRYSNCMREEKRREAFARACIEGRTQMFLIRTQESHAMVQLDMGKDRTWSVAQCNGLANVDPGPRIGEIADDLAMRCSTPITPEHPGATHLGGSSTGLRENALGETYPLAGLSAGFGEDYHRK